MKQDAHSVAVSRRLRRKTYRRAYQKALQQIDLAMLIREMRDAAGLSQNDLARRVGTTQSAIARLEDAEYAGQSLNMLERIAAACEVQLSIRAERKPKFEREVVLA